MYVQSLDQEDPLEESMATHIQYSCLVNPMERGVWWASVHRITRSQTPLKQFSTAHTILAGFPEL